MCHGYVPITYSKREILKLYYKTNNLKYNDNLHYIKEENRENKYFLNQEKENLTVFNNKPYSLFSYLPELISSKINSFKIDAIFLNEEAIKQSVELYQKGIDYILNNNEKEFASLKKHFEKNFTYDNPFIENSSFLLKEGK